MNTFHTHKYILTYISTCIMHIYAFAIFPHVGVYSGVGATEACTPMCEERGIDPPPNKSAVVS